MKREFVWFGAILLLASQIIVAKSDDPIMLSPDSMLEALSGVSDVSEDDFEELLASLVESEQMPTIEELAEAFKDFESEFEMAMANDQSEQLLAANLELPAFPGLPKPPSFPMAPAGQPPAMPNFGTPPRPAFPSVPPIGTKPPTLPSPPVLPVSPPAPVGGSFSLPSSQGGQGPETLGLSDEDIGTQGNWVKKKEWLKSARELQNKIIDLCEKMTETKQTFYRNKIKEADDLLDTFASQVGGKRGNVDTLLAAIEGKVQGQINDLGRLQEQGAHGADALTFEMYEVEEKITSHKESLEQIKLDIESIVELENSLADREEAIDGYIDVAIEDRAKSDRLLSGMFALLDHEKARLSFYEIKGLEGRVNATNDYVTKTGRDDLNNLVSTLDAQIKTVTLQLDTIVKQSDAIKDKFDTTSRTVQAQTVSQNRTPNQPIEQPQRKGFFTALWNLFSWLFGWLF